MSAPLFSIDGANAQAVVLDFGNSSNRRASMRFFLSQSQYVDTFTFKLKRVQNYSSSDSVYVRIYRRVMKYVDGKLEFDYDAVHFAGDIPLSALAPADEDTLVTLSFPFLTIQNHGVPETLKMYDEYIEFIASDGFKLGFIVVPFESGRMYVNAYPSGNMGITDAFGVSVPKGVLVIAGFNRAGGLTSAMFELSGIVGGGSGGGHYDVGGITDGTGGGNDGGSGGDAGGNTGGGGETGGNTGGGGDNQGGNTGGSGGGGGNTGGNDGNNGGGGIFDPIVDPIVDEVRLNWRSWALVGFVAALCTFVWLVVFDGGK